MFKYLLQKITGKNRYYPEVEWSGKSWTHNVFRAYELLFGRKEGIRCESSVTPIKGFDKYGFRRIKVECYTIEATCAWTETYIREFISRFSLKNFIKDLSFFRIEVLQIATAVNTPTIRIPYISFSLAYDTASTGNGNYGAGPYTWSHTCTGSHGLLTIDTQADQSTGYTVTYNSAALSSRSIITTTSTPYVRVLALFEKFSPSTGSNTASISCTSAEDLGGVSVSYSGVDSATLNYSTALEASADHIHGTLEPSISGCWIVGVVSAEGAAPYTLTNCTHRATEAFAGQHEAIDSNGIISGSVTFTATKTTRTWGIIMVAYGTYAPPSVTITETLSLSSPLTKVYNGVKSITETLSLSSPLTKVVNFLRSIVQTITTSDLKTVFAYKVISITETITTSAPVTKLVSLLKTITETINSSAQTSKQTTFSKTIIEQINASDLLFFVRENIILIVESLGLSETLIKQTLFGETIIEGLTLSDILTTNRMLHENITENLNLSDSTMKGLVYAQSVVENMTLDDILTFGRRWNFKTKHINVWTYKNKNI